MRRAGSITARRPGERGATRGRYRHRSRTLRRPAGLPPDRRAGAHRAALAPVCCLIRDGKRDHGYCGGSRDDPCRPVGIAIGSHYIINPQRFSLPQIGGPIRGRFQLSLAGRGATLEQDLAINFLEALTNIWSGQSGTWKVEPVDDPLRALTHITIRWLAAMAREEVKRNGSHREVRGRIIKTDASVQPADAFRNRGNVSLLKHLTKLFTVNRNGSLRATAKLSCAGSSLPVWILAMRMTGRIVPTFYRIV